MTLAINDAGDVLSDAGGSWKPAMRAVNDKTGETLVLDGGAWAPLPAPKATPDVTGTTEFPGYAAAEASHAPPPKLDSVLDRSNAAFSQDAEAGVAPDRMAGTPLHMPEPDSTPVTMSNGQRVKPLPYENELRSFLKPAPDAASVLPVAGTIDEGTLRPAVPSSLGELGTGVLDLLHGPETGTVTPEATGALATGIGSRALGMRSGLATSAVPESAAAVDAVRAIGSAQDVDGAIAAAGRAVVTPGDSVAPVSQLGREQAAVRAMRDKASGVAQATEAELPPAEPAPVPQSVGAAASRDINGDTTFGRSAREIKGVQADMELADLMKTPQPGDARDIIPGATQTKAEIELSPTASREAKGLRQEFREGFNEHERANNEIYHQWVDDVAPPREQTATMKDVREENWKAQEKLVFGTDPAGETVSAAPVVEHLQGLFADPIQKYNSYAKKELKPFLDALTDADGEPIELGAKELYGLRQEMGRKVKDMATNTDLAHLREIFGDLIKVTDDAITTGAPEYRTMMDEYRAASGPINAAERLQDIKTKITNGSDRIITFGALDRYMKSLWMERNGPNPYAPAKDIPQETWDHLMQLHERLARSASADELARVKGSDTTQLMMEMMRKGAIGVAHAGAAHFTGGIGNIAIPYITKQIDQSRALKKVGQHLNPDLSQYPPVVP